tara:strand:- start:260 stop:457 length:198 start_codon:yes stop_codon:yes gene_type:complete
MDWIIEDEFGNHCFPQHSFKDYEDGWSFLYETFPVIYNEDGTQDDQEAELDSYFVIGWSKLYNLN